MRLLINITLIVLTLLYPFAVYFSLEHIEPRYLALLLAVLFGLRFLWVRKGQAQRQSLWLLATVGLFALLVFVSNSESGLLFYPVLINLLMFTGFAWTLFQPPPMIERFARLSKPDLPEYAIAYTRKLTVIWCAFFLFNALVAAYTALFCSLAVWSLYNGLIAYCLVGLLFIIEYPIRLLVERRYR